MAKALMNSACIATLIAGFLVVFFGVWAGEEASHQNNKPTKPPAKPPATEPALFGSFWSSDGPKEGAWIESKYEDKCGGSQYAREALASVDSTLASNAAEATTLCTDFCFENCKDAASLAKHGGVDFTAACDFKLLDPLRKAACSKACESATDDAKKMLLTYMYRIFGKGLDIYGSKEYGCMYVDKDEALWCDEENVDPDGSGTNGCLPRVENGEKCDWDWQCLSFSCEKPTFSANRCKAIDEGDTSSTVPRKKLARLQANDAMMANTAPVSLAVAVALALVASTALNL